MKRFSNVHYRRNVVVFFIIVSTLSYLGISTLLGVQAGQALAFPSHATRCCESPSDYGMDYQQISLVTSDGYILSGWYVPTRNRAVILLLHGRGGSRVDMLPYAVFLAEQGYGLLLIDNRAHGESTGEKFAYAVWHDVEAAATYLHQKQDVKKVGIFGSSQGGVVGILGAARTLGIEAVVADGLGVVGWEDYPPRQTIVDWLYIPYDVASYLSFRWASESTDLLSLKESVRRINPRPILLITAGAVDTISEFERKVTYGVYATAGEQKDLWIVPDTIHCSGLATHADEYKSRLIMFFNRTLLN